MATIQEIETTILAVVRDYIGSYANQLGALGLAYEVSIRRNFSTPNGYQSETRVEFKDENGPWDLLEFEIANRGKVIISIEDVKRWLPDAFSSVVARRQEETHHSDRRVQ